MSCTERDQQCYHVGHAALARRVHVGVSAQYNRTIPILTIIVNNGALGGYEKHMPVATERYRTKFISGDYAAVAEGLGSYSERVEQPADIIPAIERAKAAIANEKPALLEIVTREEGAFSHQKIL